MDILSATHHTTYPTMSSSHQYDPYNPEYSSEESRQYPQQDGQYQGTYPGQLMMMPLYSSPAASNPLNNNTLVTPAPLYARPESMGYQAQYPDMRASQPSGPYRESWASAGTLYLATPSISQAPRAPQALNDAQLLYTPTDPQHMYLPGARGLQQFDQKPPYAQPLPAGRSPPQSHLHQGVEQVTTEHMKNLLKSGKSSSSSTGKRKPRVKKDSQSDDEEFQCTYCDKSFSKNYNLNSHLKAHSSAKPFQCSFCDRSFARNHDKKRHEYLHQGVKRFQCGGTLKDNVTHWGCGKRFSRADGLGRHFRTDVGWLCIRPLMVEAKESEGASVTAEDQYDYAFVDNLLKNAQS